MIRTLFMLVSLLGCLLPLSGQYRLETSRKNDTTAVSDSTKTIYTKPSPLPSPASYRRPYSDNVEFTIKANPGLLLRGQLPLYVEYRINNYFTFEGAVGITYIDLVYETAVNGGYYLGNKRAKFRNGFLAATQFRMFPFQADVAPRGFYTGPQLAARNYLMNWYTNTGFLYQKELEVRRVYDMRWVAGWQNPNSRDEWFFDFYAALGMRYISETRKAEIANVTLPAAKRFIPSGEIGLKIGYGL